MPTLQNCKLLGEKKNTHPIQIPLAELALQSGTKLLLICGGEPERDILGAKLGAQLARRNLGGNGEMVGTVVGWFSNGMDL